MTLKSQVEYRCPQCHLAWLPYMNGLMCPACQRIVPNEEVTGILGEALESARFNKRLYGRYDLEYWIAHRLGDRYLQWGFKALQIAADNPETIPDKVALAALFELDLEEMAPYRPHLMGFLARLVELFREAVSKNSADWEKMPEPEKPFFGRKIIDENGSE